MSWMGFFPSPGTGPDVLTVADSKKNTSIPLNCSTEFNSTLEYIILISVEQLREDTQLFEIHLI